MALPVIILLLIIYGYTLIILLFSLEIERDVDPSTDPKDPPAYVSVVVPFRNEEDHLPGLLEDFAGQTYPAEHMEIIFVDDHSEDGSASIVTSGASQNQHFHHLELPPQISGKKKALFCPARRARYPRQEILLGQNKACNYEENKERSYQRNDLSVQRKAQGLLCSPKVCHTFRILW